MIFGFLPSFATAVRIAAKSTSSGTPVKSCSTMRATTNGISAVRVSVGLPVGEFLDVRLVDFFAVAIAQDGFQHEADGNRQFGDRADAGFFQRGQRIEFSRLAVAEFKVLQGAEKIM